MDRIAEFFSRSASSVDETLLAPVEQANALFLYVGIGLGVVAIIGIIVLLVTGKSGKKSGKNPEQNEHTQVVPEPDRRQKNAEADRKVQEEYEIAEQNTDKTSRKISKVERKVQAAPEVAVQEDEKLAETREQSEGATQTADEQPEQTTQAQSGEVAGKSTPQTSVRASRKISNVASRRDKQKESESVGEFAKTQEPELTQESETENEAAVIEEAKNAQEPEVSEELKMEQAPAIEPEPVTVKAPHTTEEPTKASEPVKNAESAKIVDTQTKISISAQKTPDTGTKIMNAKPSARQVNASRASQRKYVKMACIHGVGAEPAQQNCYAVSDISHPEHVKRLGAFAVLADGGGKNGAEVSYDVVAYMLGEFNKGRTGKAIKTLAKEANERVLGKCKRHSHASMVAVGIKGEELYFVSAGDCTVSIFRGEHNIELNRQHTNLTHIYEEIAMKGMCGLPEKMVTSFIGAGDMETDYNILPIHMQVGDRIVIMNSAVGDSLYESDILDCMYGKDVTSGVKNLEKLVVSAQDVGNYTAIVMEICSIDDGK